MGQPVFRSALADPRQSHHPGHLVLVTLEHSNRVSKGHEIWIVQLAFGGSPNRTFGFGKAVRVVVAQSKTAVPKDKVGIGREFLLGCLDRSLISACSKNGKPLQQIQGTWILSARVVLK